MIPARLVLLAATFLLCVANPRAATRLHLELVAPDATEVDLDLSADGKPLCRLRGATAAGLSCDADWPAGAMTWRVRGRYAIPGLLGLHRRVQGEAPLTLLDIGPVVLPLDAGKAPYGQRMATFLDVLQRFRHDHLDDASVPLAQRGEPATAAQLDAAQRRLGFALPADFVSLQTQLGALKLGDHGITDVAHLDDAHTQMLRLWGTPEEALRNDYSDAFRDLLRQSTILFTEEGDGYGGLLYRPGPTKACGAGGTYYWTQQEGGTQVLKRADGRCMDFAAAMRWLVDGLVLEALADDLAEAPAGAVLVDSALPAQTLDLTLSGEGDAFAVQLRARWPGPHD